MCCRNRGPTEYIEYENREIHSFRDSIRSVMENQDRAEFSTPNPLFHLKIAVLEGNTHRIEQILQEHNGDLRTTSEVENTLLHLTLQYNNSSPIGMIKILDMFISRGIDINIKNCRQETVLHLAVAKRNREIIDYLLQRGAKMDVTDDQGNSIPYILIQNLSQKSRPKVIHDDKICGKSDGIQGDSEHMEFVEWLLSRGFDFNSKNKAGQSALQLAIEKNLQDILPFLLKSASDKDCFSNFGNETLLQSFLKVSRKKGCNFCKAGKSDPCTACYQPYNIEIVKLLLEKGVSVDHKDEQGLTALNLVINAATTKADMDVVEMIFDRFTICQDEHGHSLLCTLIEKTTLANIDGQLYSKMLAAFISKHKGFLNSKGGWRPIYKAFVHKNTHAIESMKKNNINFDVISDDGSNLFHALVDNKSKDDRKSMFYQEELFEYLVRQNYDVNLRNCNGETPLYLAIRQGFNLSIIRKFIAHATDMNSRSKDGSTPLFWAVFKNLESVVKLLLKKGANVNGIIRLNNRPLHMAAGSPETSILKLLLKNKAEVNVRDSAGNSALSRAIRAGRVGNVKELLAFGADANDTCVIQSVEQCGNKAQILMSHHYFKLKAAKLPYSHHIKLHLAKNPALFNQKYLEEVDELKKTYIDSRTSLYQWLHMDPYRRFLHCHNEKLRNLIESPVLSKQFPQYSTVVLGYYRETEVRKALFEPAKQVWLEFTEIHLPDICLEHIFAYLNTGELFEIIELAG